jgi:hypothetical protein
VGLFILMVADDAFSHVRAVYREARVTPMAGPRHPHSTVKSAPARLPASVI